MHLERLQPLEVADRRREGAQLVVRAGEVIEVGKVSEGVGDVPNRVVVDPQRLERGQLREGAIIQRGELGVRDIERG